MALKKSELYSSIWQACDQLRGGMDASQYKDYVLVLLFVKYVSDKYGKAPDPVIVIPQADTPAMRMWVNLEFAKKPENCLEYIIVHELLHLIEKYHNDKFKALMDKYLPDWRVRKDVLNRFPLSHEEWEY